MNRNRETGLKQPSLQVAQDSRIELLCFTRSTPASRHVDVLAAHRFVNPVPALDSRM
jgi:hypothetical protein